MFDKRIHGIKVLRSTEMCINCLDECRKKHRRISHDSKSGASGRVQGGPTLLL
jgi:hypothetical protein